ncbi:WhiB family transcriptional regulator [Streptomyces sp. 1222.5]|uniref:WhiB family transcriptional regulator n=1 Tax=Streptomyces sp. 1222.5 TaxID=1881026 RepID=UPI003EBAD15B
MDIHWGARAACGSRNPEELFVEGTAQRRAVSICAGCAVRTECLAHALDNRIRFGVWGGMTERDRRALLHRRPSVTSWRRLLHQARVEYERSTARPMTRNAGSEPVTKESEGSPAD